MKFFLLFIAFLSTNQFSFSQCDTTIVSEAEGNWELNQLRHGVFIAQSKNDYKKFYRYSSEIDFTSKMLISFYACCVCRPAESELKITYRPDSVIFTYTVISKNNHNRMPCGSSSDEFIIDKINLSNAYFRLKVISRKETREWSVKYDNKSTIIKLYDEPIITFHSYKKPNSN
jgi:hypothetical protein